MKDSFLQQVTRDLVARVGLDGLENYTLVFPMQRAGLFVKQYLFDLQKQSGHHTPIVLPDFTTIDLLADRLCELRSDDEIASVFRLYRAYSTHVPHAMPADAFYGWGQQLLSDISNVDMFLLDVEKMMQLTADVGVLDEILIDPDVRLRLETLLRQQGAHRSVREFFVSLWQVLPAIYRDFKAAEEALGVGTRGARTRWVIEHFSDTSVQQQLEGRHFVFVGFNYLLGAERQLMQLLRNREPNATFFYWDMDPSFPLQNGIYDFIPTEIKRFGNALPTAEQADSAQPSHITAIAFGSSAGQAQYVHRWLLEHHHPGEKTAIVVADESILPQVVNSLPPDPSFGHINITKGYALRSTRIFSQTIALLEEAAESDMPSEELIRTVSNRLENRYRQLRPYTEDHWQIVLTDEAYYQTQLVLRQLLLLIRRDAYVAECLTDSHLLVSLLRRRLEMVSIPFHGEPVTDIQLIGVLETRLLDFDHVLILNVEEGVVPNTAADRSFLPLDLRKEYHMQTRDEEAKIYGYNFFRLLRRAQDVTITFSEATTDTGKKTMSRFLMQMLTSPAYTVNRLRVTEADERMQTEPTDAIYDEQQGDRRPNHLSPSAISDYIECPKEFYLKHIRRIRTADEESVFFSVSTLGTLVHAVLEAAYTQQKEGASIDWEAALHSAYLEVNRRYHEHHPDEEEDPYIEAEHAVENHAILEMAKRVVTADKQLEQMEILRLEKELTIQLEGVQIKGVIDRLDCVRTDGRDYVRILDYKTGSYVADKMRFEQLSELFSNSDKRYALQTLIYCEMLLQNSRENPRSELPICPELFFTKQPSEDRRLQWIIGKQGVKTLTRPLLDYQAEAATDFQALLQAKVKEIMTAPIYPMADKKQCEDSHCYCPFHLLCGREKKDF